MIITQGKKFRTLSDKIYVNGAQAKAVYVNGIQVYPETKHVVSYGYSYASFGIKFWSIYTAQQTMQYDTRYYNAGVGDLTVCETLWKYFGLRITGPGFTLETPPEIAEPILRGSNAESVSFVCRRLVSPMHFDITLSSGPLGLYTVELYKREPIISWEEANWATHINVMWNEGCIGVQHVYFVGFGANTFVCPLQNIAKESHNWKFYGNKNTGEWTYESDSGFNLIDLDSLILGQFEFTNGNAIIDGRYIDYDEWGHIPVYPEY